MRRGRPAAGIGLLRATGGRNWRLFPSSPSIRLRWSSATSTRPCAATRSSGSALGRIHGHARHDPGNDLSRARAAIQRESGARAGRRHELRADRARGRANCYQEVLGLARRGAAPRRPVRRRPRRGDRRDGGSGVLRGCRAAGGSASMGTAASRTSIPTVRWVTSWRPSSCRGRCAIPSGRIALTGRRTSQALAPRAVVISARFGSDWRCAGPARIALSRPTWSAGCELGDGGGLARRRRRVCAWSGGARGPAVLVQPVHPGPTGVGATSFPRS